MISFECEQLVDTINWRVSEAAQIKMTVRGNTVYVIAVRTGISMFDSSPVSQKAFDFAKVFLCGIYCGLAMK